MRILSCIFSAFSVTQNAFISGASRKGPQCSPAFLFQWSSISSRCSGVVLSPPPAVHQISSQKLKSFIQYGTEAFKDGDYSTATAMWEKVVTSMASLPSDCISRTMLLNCCSNLAAVYRITGNTVKEMDSLLTSMDLIEKCFGKTHPQYVQLLCRLAEANENMGKYQEMKSVLLEALQLIEKQGKSCKADFKASKVLLLLSRSHQNLNETHEQLKTAQKGTELIRQHFAAEHRFSTTGMFTLARALGASGNEKEQLRLAQKAYDTQESQLGSCHSELLESAVQVAAAYRAVGDPAKEKEYLERALVIQKQAHEPFRGPKAVDIQIQIGDAHIKSDSSENRWSIALSFYLNAIRTARKHLTAPNPSLSRALLRASQCYKYLGNGNIDKSAELLVEAEKVYIASKVANTHVCATELHVEKKMRSLTE